MRPNRLVLTFLIGFLAAGLPTLAVGQPTALKITVFEDPTGRRTIDQVTALPSGAFKPLVGGRLAGGLSKSV